MALKSQLTSFGNQSPLFHWWEVCREALHGLDQNQTALPNQKILVARDHLNFALSLLFFILTHASCLNPYAYLPYTLSINPSFSSSRTMLSSIRLSTVTLLPGACFNASSSWIFIPSRVV